MSEKGVFARERARPAEANDGTTSTGLPREEMNEDPTGNFLPLSIDDNPREPIPAPTERAWAMAFKINVAITAILVVCALVKGTTAEWNLTEMGNPILVLVMMVAPAYGVSRCVLHAIFRWATQILQVALLVLMVVCVVTVIWMLNCGAILGAVVVGVVCAVIAPLFLRPGRVGLAAASLKVAALAVRSVPKMFVWSICVAAIRYLWLVATGMALAVSIDAFETVRALDGTTYRAADCHNGSRGFKECECNGSIISNDWCNNSSPNIFLVCFWMWTMGWGCAVCTNVMHATVASSVASWWSSEGDVDSLRRSSQYAIKGSLGSLSKGAAIYGGIELLNQGFQLLPYQGFGWRLGWQSFLFPMWGGGLTPIAEMVSAYMPEPSLFYLLESFGTEGFPLFFAKLVIKYGLGYTAVFVGMYRLGFSKAAGRAKALFRNIGMVLLANEMLVALGLFFVGLPPFGLPIYVMYCGLRSLPFGQALLVWFAMLLSMACGVILLPILEVVLCASRAVLVCFVQDPEVFPLNHGGQLHDDLNRAWQDMRLPSPTTRNINRDVQV